MTGEAELRGKGKEAAEKEHIVQRHSEEQEKRNAYLGYVDRGTDEGEMASAVAAGLQAHKKSKKLLDGAASMAAPTKSVTESLPSTASVSLSTLSGADKEQEVVSTAAAESLPPSQDKGLGSSQALEPDDKLVSSEGPPWLHVLAGEALTGADGFVEGIDGFCTLAVPHVNIGRQTRDPEATSAVPGVERWYYEVDLVTGGLFQVGGYGVRVTIHRLPVAY